MYSVVLMMALSGSADAPEFLLGGRGCNGCQGCNGCRGGRCHGCQGSRGGCHGCRGSRGCHGCRGSRGCHGCNGGYVGCHGGCYGGCYGGAGCAGCAGTIVVPTDKKTKKMPPAGTQSEVPATILVSLPADARLTIDGNPTTSTSSERTFVSPALPQGQQFQYTLRAEIIRDGRTIAETQQINVRAGEETRVGFNFSSTGVASR
jgi:uncharacterized protein (TIGR03000 family)